MIDSNLFTSSDISILFSNAQDLMILGLELHSKLLKRKESDPYMTFIVEILMECVDSFKIYSVYCGNYPKASKKYHQLCQNQDEGTAYYRILK